MIVHRLFSVTISYLGDQLIENSGHVCSIRGHSRFLSVLVAIVNSM